MQLPAHSSHRLLPLGVQLCWNKTKQNKHTNTHTKKKIKLASHNKILANCSLYLPSLTTLTYAYQIHQPNNQVFYNFYLLFLFARTSRESVEQPNSHLSGSPERFPSSMRHRLSQISGAIKAPFIFR